MAYVVYEKQEFRDQIEEFHVLFFDKKGCIIGDMTGIKR